MYYYSSNGRYKTLRAAIDIIIIIMAVVMLGLLGAIVFWQSQRHILFPLIFASGALVNILCAVKKFFNKNRRGGAFLTMVGILLIVLAAACRSVMRP